MSDVEEPHAKKEKKEKHKKGGKAKGGAKKAEKPKVHG